jgi:hypothetical protein
MGRPKFSAHIRLGRHEIFGVFASNNPQVTDEEKASLGAGLVELQETVQVGLSSESI